MIECLPVELIGTNVLGYLSIEYIVTMERACYSKESHRLFLNSIPYCPPVSIPYTKHIDVSALDWLSKRQCKLNYLLRWIHRNHPDIDIKDLQVDYCDLFINYETNMNHITIMIENKLIFKVRSLSIEGNQNKEVMEKLSVYAENVHKLHIRSSENYMEWLTDDILSRWKLKEIDIDFEITTHWLLLIAQTCTELTSIKLTSYIIYDDVVSTIAQHFPKLRILELRSQKLTWSCLRALSESKVPLEILCFNYLPKIPTADIAKSCSHALSCIRHLDTDNLSRNGHKVHLLIPYMIGLTSVRLIDLSPSYIHLLTQYCRKLTKIDINTNGCSSVAVLSLCRVNPLIETFIYKIRSFSKFIDTALIELIHACPHLHTLDISYETNITDIGILALSEHCTQLQELQIYRCKQITEAAVLQLLQRCRKLTRLHVSSSSLSEETWTQLDKNTQKRVRRW